MKTSEAKRSKGNLANFLILSAVIGLAVGTCVSLIFDEALQNVSDSSKKLELIESGRWLFVMLRQFLPCFFLLSIIFLCGFGAIFQPPVFLILALRGFGLGAAAVRSSLCENPLISLLALLPLAVSQTVLLLLMSKASVELSNQYYFITVSNENRLGLKNQAQDHIHLFFRLTIILLIFCAVDCLYIRLLCCAL